MEVIEDQAWAQKCHHYRRGCDIVAPCCGNIVPDRKCHDENGICSQKLDRKAVSEVQCRRCELRQPVAALCIACGLLFGHYFCSICKLWDYDDKGHFHCEGCGTCRVGGRENYVHCDVCKACYSKEVFPTHRCQENIMESHCAVCLETCKSSSAPLMVPACGHMIHHTCVEDLMGSGSKIKCPICAVTLQSKDEAALLWEQMDAQIAETPLPEDMQDWSIDIVCNDCQTRARARYHVLGLKCTNTLCGSYNTNGKCPKSSPLHSNQQLPKKFVLGLGSVLTLCLLLPRTQHIPSSARYL